MLLGVCVNAYFYATYWAAIEVLLLILEVLVLFEHNSVSVGK